jgi:hypothetical protein
LEDFAIDVIIPISKQAFQAPHAQNPEHAREIENSNSGSSPTIDNPLS